MRSVRSTASRSSTRPAALLALGLSLATLGPGCKYNGYSIRAPYEASVRTVYVPVFKTITFRRDLNLYLTELVCKEIERRTPYKVVGNPEGADTTLEGTITYAEKNVVIENPNNLPRQLTSTMVIAITWTDNKAEEKKNPNPAVVSDTFNFYPEIGESAEAAFYRTAEKMAIQIVNMMEQPW